MPGRPGRDGQRGAGAHALQPAHARARGHPDRGGDHRGRGLGRGGVAGGPASRPAHRAPASTTRPAASTRSTTPRRRADRSSCAAASSSRRHLQGRRRPARAREAARPRQRARRPSSSARTSSRSSAGRRTRARPSKVAFTTGVETEIEPFWGGQHEFFLRKKGWSWLGATVKSTSRSRTRRTIPDAHLTIKPVKVPADVSLGANVEPGSPTTPATRS